MTPAEKQDLRHAALRAMALRPSIAHTPEMVHTWIRRWLPFQVDTQDVRDALNFIADLGHAERLLDDYGAEQYFRITAEGMLAHERSQTP